MLSLTLTLALLAPAPQGQVVINEVSYDDSGTDDREYVELYNPTNSDITIGGWVLEATDTATPDNNADYTITANATIKAGGFYVLGAATVPNVSQVVGTTNLWENSQESVTLKNGSTIVDTLVYEVNKGWPAAKNNLKEGEGIWGNFTDIDNHQMSWSRKVDGLDTDNNGLDFALLPGTPGKSNALTGKLPYADTYDAKGVGAILAEFIGSFADGVVIDPTTMDANNPNAIAASPQGGKAAAFWDKAGGGNTNVLLASIGNNGVFEALVYFDTKTVPAGEHETWSIGFGSTGTYYNSPDPGGTLGFTANGNVGVSWTYQILSTGATLYLVDHNDGGWGANAVTKPTVIGKISVTKSGWQRLRLEIVDDTVVGSYGGTFGCADGQNFAAKLGAPLQHACCYIGYREFLVNNATARPVTIDAVSIRASTSAVSTIGVATKTTKGTPDIGTNSPPSIGNSKFAICLTGMGANAAGAIVIGPRQNPPIDLGAVGGQRGSMIYVQPFVVLGVTANAQGEANLRSPVACNRGFLGGLAYWQGVVVDTALTVPIKVGNSAAIETKFGN